MATGIEVVSLIIGVVPIFVEILKSYGRASEKLGTFKRYHKAVREIELDFRIERKKFRDECDHLLAIIIEDNYERQSMLQDLDDRRWRDRDTDSRFRTFLGDDYGDCEELVVIIRDLLRETTADLEHLGRVSERAGHSDSSTDTFRHVFDAFNICFKESKYKRRLEELCSWNAKLRQLRKRKRDIQKLRHFSSTSVLSRRIPSSFSKIREASKALHSSLEDAWSCSNASHEDHQAKLWLDAKVDFDAVRLDMAISCRQKYAQSNQRPPGSPIWMCVRSVTTKNENGEPAPVSVPLGIKLAASLQVGSDRQALSHQPQSQRSSLLAGIKRCRKTVRFDSETTKDDDLEPPPPKDPKPAVPPVNSDQCHSMLNLRNIESFCSHLNQFCTSPADCKASCLGFLEVQDTFKFIFYNAGERATTGQNQRSNGKEAQPLKDALNGLARLQRLLLAYRLAKAVLHYYSTSWLPEDWRLQDLSFFGERTQCAQDALVQDLQTLHLSTQFPQKPDPAPQPAGVFNVGRPMASQGASMEATYYAYGIKNMTLAKLGLALLEIGHRRDIGSFRLGQPHDVMNARILVERSHTELGGRYHRIAQRCLDCDFSSGGDLDKESLQSAVYSHVVCELEELIKAHERFQAKIS